MNIILMACGVYVLFVFIVLLVDDIAGAIRHRKLVKCARQYKQIKSQQEKATFLMTTFGKDGMDYIGLMENYGEYWS